MLSSLKVIELSTVLAGPSVGMFFAELGADVLKIEHPDLPDVTRSWKLPTEEMNDQVSAYFSSVNYKKSYSRLNLLLEDDQIEMHKLIAGADILLMNFKKGDDRKFRLTKEEIQQINPKIIIGKISGFGEESDRVAYDLILQAESGFMSMNGTENSGPVKMPVALIDVLAAHQLKEGILAALLKRMSTGKGAEVSVSLYDAAVSSLVNQASNYLMENHVPQRIGSLHPNIAPYGELFETSDKKLVTFAIGSNAHFQKLCSYLKSDGLITDERFASNYMRVKNRLALSEILQQKLSLLSSEEIDLEMKKLHVPMGIIRTLDEVFNDDSARKLIREEKINEKNTKRVTSVAFRVS